MIVDGVDANGVQERVAVFDPIAKRLAIELVQGNFRQILRYKLGKRRWPAAVLAAVPIQRDDRHDGIPFLRVTVERRQPTCGGYRYAEAARKPQVRRYFET